MDFLVSNSFLSSWRVSFFLGGGGAGFLKGIFSHKILKSKVKILANQIAQIGDLSQS